jgi:acyl-CoA thioester hydrolase
MQGVVFNGHYLTYADVGITEYFRELRIQGNQYSVVRTVLEYKAAARFDDLLEISVRVIRLGRSSMQMLVAMWRGAELLTTAELTYVHTDLHTRSSLPIPQQVRDQVMAFEKVAPEG